eukprot:TRINITY_DN27940_c0_g1_i1.p1 TRINITY_DN27940_c0_g1~~TRINITY_DN27940_c0_g1_i1.p1  ORF type:complete len:672 (-),score=124.21 TRINITY_DN27940_c0_g1_i1:56-2071(-)
MARKTVNSIMEAAQHRFLKSVHYPSSRHGKNQDRLHETIGEIEEMIGVRKVVEHPPWMADDGVTMLWSRPRVLIAKVIHSHLFDSVMGIIITANVALIWWESDLDAHCYPEYESRVNECPYSSTGHEIISNMNFSLLVFYTLECFVRIYVDRGKFCLNMWNVTDSGIVLVGWLATITEGTMGLNLNFMRVCRVVRLVRAARILLAVRELYLLLSGLMSSFKTIFFGTLFLLVTLILCGIVVVQLVHPINAGLEYVGCDECSSRFESVAKAGLTLFQQIVAGDSWGLISVPVIEARPFVAGPVLIIVNVGVGLGLMNLILAVIVERAVEARESDTATRAKEKAREQQKSMIEFAVMCANLDEDGSGTVSAEELLNGYDRSVKFQALMSVIDVRREDLARVYDHILNADEQNDSSEIRYKDLCEQLHLIQSRDMRMAVFEVFAQVMELQRSLKALGKTQGANEEASQQRHRQLLAALLGRTPDLLQEVDLANGNSGRSSEKEGSLWIEEEREESLVDDASTRHADLKDSSPKQEFSASPSCSSQACDAVGSQVELIRQKLEKLRAQKEREAHRLQQQADSLAKQSIELYNIQAALQDGESKLPSQAEIQVAKGLLAQLERNMEQNLSNSSERTEMRQREEIQEQSGIAVSACMVESLTGVMSTSFREKTVKEI